MTRKRRKVYPVTPILLDILIWTTDLANNVESIYMKTSWLGRFFEEWLKPFADMGASTVTIRNTSGTDHLSFNSEELPAFQFILDEIEYGRGYNTPMDTYERLVMADLKQNAVITASFVCNAAMRNVKWPPKPVMEEKPEA